MPDPDSHLTYGGPGPLREFVAECLHKSAFYSDMAVRYATEADDVGLEFSTRKAVATLKQGVAVLRLLIEKNEQIAAKREAKRNEHQGKRPAATNKTEPRQ